MRSRTTGTLTLAKDSRTTRQEISPNAWGNQLEREVTLRPTTKGSTRRTTKALAVEMERLLQRPGFISHGQQGFVHPRLQNISIIFKA
jgi:hypothetical protein